MQQSNSATHPLDDQVLNIHAAASRAGVSPATLKRCASRGEIRILQLSPRRIGIRASELTAWLDSKRRPALGADGDDNFPPAAA